MKVRVYQKAFEFFTQETHPDLFATLSEEGKKRVGTFGRILSRGKQNKEKVAVLIDNKNKEAIEWLCNENIRREVGIPDKNDLIFGLPGDARDVNKFVKGHPTMAKFVAKIKSQMENPDVLKCGLLRIAVATLGLILNLGASDIRSLSDFMGHDYQIHKKYYELPPALKDIVDMSVILEKAVGTYDVDEKGSRPSDQDVTVGQRKVKVSKEDQSDEELESPHDKVQDNDKVKDNDKVEDTDKAEFIESCINAENNPGKFNAF